MNREIENKLNRWLGKADLDEALRTELETLAGIKRNATSAGCAEAPGKTTQPQNGEVIFNLQTQLQAKELEDCFYKDLEFGTGGLRGLLGAGTNRLNIYTVRKATQGIADYICAAGLKKAVAVSYDSRINSKLFAENTAGVMLANGIDVFLFDELMPAPALSFATRYHECSIGIMITASHNPKDYNGYKVYNGRGCQVTLEQADDILSQIEKTEIFDDVKYLDINSEKHGKSACDCQLQIDDETGAAMPLATSTAMTEAAATGASGDVPSDASGDAAGGALGAAIGSLTWMTDETKEAYIQAVMSQSLGIAKSELANIKVAYTPLNGAGNKPVREMMHRLGVKEENIFVVAEQENPDGNFPTCPYPNPEKKEVLEKGLALLKNTKSDILIATDPDSDRLGLAVRVDSNATNSSNDCQSQIGDATGGQTQTPTELSTELSTGLSTGLPTELSTEALVEENTDNQVKILTGNEVGLLMLDFVCSMRQQQGQKPLPQNPVVVRTMVTSRMTDAIAANYGVKVKTTLTGFKFIGEHIGELEDEGCEENFVFGFEESCGYLSGTYVRDKDGVNAALLACEMAAYYKARGITLAQRMEQLYQQYGYCQNSLIEFTLKGADGMKKMAEIMESFRNNPPTEIIGSKIISKTDYMKQEIYIKGDCARCDLVAGTKPTGLPKSDVMEFALANGTTFTVRPSGTEPKLKIYIFAQSKSRPKTQEIIDRIKVELTTKVESI